MALLALDLFLPPTAGTMGRGDGGAGVGEYRQKLCSSCRDRYSIKTSVFWNPWMNSQNTENPEESNLCPLHTTVQQCPKPPGVNWGINNQRFVSHVFMNLHQHLNFDHLVLLQKWRMNIVNIQVCSCPPKYSHAASHVTPFLISQPYFPHAQDFNLVFWVSDIVKMHNSLSPCFLMDFIQCWSVNTDVSAFKPTFTN